METSRRSRRGPIRAMVTVLVLGLALAPVVLSTACSTPGASTSADAAAAAVAQDFAVPADAEACLVDRFGSDPGTRRLLTTTSEPTADQRKALGDAVDACVTPDQFAAAVAARITANLPPADTADTATQIDCLTSSLLALSPTQHEDLLVGLLLLSVPATGDLATARSDVLNDVTGACAVTPGN